MSLFQAIILAIVQGLTEFLPVSSSGHLILIPWLLKWPDHPLAFDVALHAGTLVAVLLYFVRDWIELTLAGLGFHYPRDADSAIMQRNRKMFWYLIAATVPGAVVGFLFEHKIEETLRNPAYVAGAMILIALLMWYAEYAGKLDRGTDRLGFADAMTVGTAQALALFPGVSRSGITITAALFRGMTREAAARFSFLLSTPIIAGAAAVELPKLLKLQRAGHLDMSVPTLWISVAVSAIVGYLVIGLLLRYLQTRTFKIFIYYRLLFGIVVLLLLHMGFAR